MAAKALPVDPLQELTCDVCQKSQQIEAFRAERGRPGHNFVLTCHICRQAKKRKRMERAVAAAQSVVISDNQLRTFRIRLINLYMMSSVCNSFSQFSYSFFFFFFFFFSLSAAAPPFHAPGPAADAVERPSDFTKWRSIDLVLYLKRHHMPVSFSITQDGLVMACKILEDRLLTEVLLFAAPVTW